MSMMGGEFVRLVVTGFLVENPSMLNVLFKFGNLLLCVLCESNILAKHQASSEPRTYFVRGE